MNACKSVEQLANFHKVSFSLFLLPRDFCSLAPPTFSQRPLAAASKPRQKNVLSQVSDGSSVTTEVARARRKRANVRSATCSPMSDCVTLSPHSLRQFHGRRCLLSLRHRRRRRRILMALSATSATISCAQASLASV